MKPQRSITKAMALLVLIALATGCARMHEGRESRARREIERQNERYRAVVQSLPDDPAVGVPLLEPFFEPDKLTPHVLRYDYDIVRRISEDVVVSSISNIQFDETGNYAVVKIRFLRQKPGGRESFDSFESKWKRINGRWLLALDNFWVD